MTLKVIKRFCNIIYIFFKYNLEDLIPSNKLNLFFNFKKYFLFWLPKNKINNIGKQLRLALENLGPIWIKLGQMLSTRKDLFSSDIFYELSLLQNQVSGFNGKLAKKKIEKELGCPIESYFQDFNENPLASASISQIHTAKLKKNKKKIIIKIIRPNIFSIIKLDLRLMYLIAKLFQFLIKKKNLQFIEIVQEYEKILINELNLLNEANNAIKLKKNFKNSSILYIPKIYLEYCRKKILVMERIDGIPISKINILKKTGINMKLLAENGVEIFFTQVLRDSFFHADMHPGNIFINKKKILENPQYISVDFGIIGILSKEDKIYLAKNFLAFFNRDYKKISQLHIKLGLIPRKKNIQNFELAIKSFCEPFFKKPISEISFSHILWNLFNTAKKFNIKLKPQLFLLQKTLFYIEGLGKQIYPQLNLWKTAKYFLETWLQKQLNIRNLFNIINKKKILLYSKKTKLKIKKIIYKKQLMKENKIKKINKKNKNKKNFKKKYLFWCAITTLLICNFLKIYNLKKYEYFFLNIATILFIIERKEI